MIYRYDIVGEKNFHCLATVVCLRQKFSFSDIFGVKLKFEMSKKSESNLQNAKKQITAKKPVDLSVCVPLDLYDRIAKVFPMPCTKDDPFEEKPRIEFRELLREIDPTLPLTDDADVDEDKIIEMMERQARRKSYVLNIEPKVERRMLTAQPNINWIASYAKKMKKERIVWQTKLFKEDQDIQKKPLFEQIEVLIDIAADHFSVWLKEMDDESNINKEFVKQLFSINVESDASKALCVDSFNEVKVIPHEVANMISMPQLSIQNNLIKMLKADKKRSMKKPSMVAFGRTLPKEIRRKKFDEELFDNMYKLNCPEELRSLRTVFESILHLKSTQALIDYLKVHPELPRSKFLVDCNLFDVKKSEKSTKQQQKPLWSYYF